MSGGAPRAAPVSPPRPPKDPPPRLASSPRVTALAAAHAAGDAHAVERFWDEVAASGTPMVEDAPDPAERIVTFLWRDRHGAGPGTDAVILMANKLTDPSVWRECNLERLAGTDVWHRSFLLRADWRATYHLAPDDLAGGRAQERPVEAGSPRRWDRVAHLAQPDPLNARRFAARRGGEPTSVVELPDAPAQPWVAPRPGVPAGTVTAHRVRSPELGNEREVWIYTPAGVDTGDATRLPVLVLLDGEDWRGRLGAPATLDNLIADGRIPPTLAVMPDALDVPTRWHELTCLPEFGAFLLDTLLPWVVARHRASDDPADTTIAGQSIGGLTAAHLAITHPDRVGAAVVQSASLWWSGDGEPGWLARACARPAGATARISLQVGLEEWTLLEDHRTLRDALERAGHRVAYHEYNGGHDAFCWRGGLADGLIALAQMEPARP